MTISKRSRISLRLSVLVVTLFLLFSFQFQPSVEAFPGCSESCFQRCYDNWLDCIDTSGGNYAACCHYNGCARFCGDDCPLFCAE